LDLTEEEEEMEEVTSELPRFNLRQEREVWEIHRLVGMEVSETVVIKLVRVLKHREVVRSMGKRRRVKVLVLSWVSVHRLPSVLKQ
jgi:site-specific recombinase XerD